MKIYLAGPINGRSDEDCKGWRAAARAALGAERVLDPMDRDYRGREGRPGVARSIVEQDKRDVLASSALLVYFDAPSVGTAMEVLLAWQNRIPVFIVNRSGRDLSPWMVYHASGVFYDLGSALAHIVGAQS